ncbi:hypothetical protein C0993_012533 [Termitomyces sp. T159_Od127]|nr:hypothetical protein C0993_012533 [Termitomyces sp. T159_Od127]
MSGVTNYVDLILPHVASESNNIFAVPSRSSSVAGSKSKRKIPNCTHRAQIPSIRKVPSNLYAIPSSQSTHRGVLLTELSVSQGTLMRGQLKAFPEFTSQHGTHGALTRASRVIEKPAPISIPEVKWMASTSSPPDAGVDPASMTIPKLGPTFIDILTENKRKNRYAPTMVSLLNPLRDKVPARAWAHLPYHEHGHAPSGSFFLPSPRFNRVLDSRLARSRR